jgi:hypothetical protein
MSFVKYPNSARLLTLVLVFVAVAVGGTIFQSNKHGENAKSPLKTMLIDDFSKTNSKKNLSTNWEFVSDRVIGGYFPPDS